MHSDERATHAVEIGFIFYDTLDGMIAGLESSPKAISELSRLGGLVTLDKSCACGLAGARAADMSTQTVAEDREQACRYIFCLATFIDFASAL